MENCSATVLGQGRARRLTDSGGVQRILTDFASLLPGRRGTDLLVPRTFCCLVTLLGCHSTGSRRVRPTLASNPAASPRKTIPDPPAETNGSEMPLVGMLFV